MAARADACSPLDSDGLFNEMQARKNWPSGGPPAVFDLRHADAYAKQHVRGAFHATVSPDDGELTVAGGSGWYDKAVCVYDETAESLEDHPVVVKLLADARARRVYFLTETYEAFHTRYPFLCARGSSSSAMKRPPAYPSCIIPGLLYLGDLEDAAALPRLREHLNIRHAVTALADPPQSLKASVAEAKVDHTWCNVRDVEGGDIKEHFDKAIGAIERGSAKGHAVFVHCSRGVSRSASLCIAYLMKARKMSAADARELVVGRRAIVLPNDGFWRCLQAPTAPRHPIIPAFPRAWATPRRARDSGCTRRAPARASQEYEKELTGERSGVYVPAKTKRLEEFEVEIPPAWAAPPSVAYAKLSIVKDGEEIDEVDVGEHTSYTFGRSLTCDFPLEHPSVRRRDGDCSMTKETSAMATVISAPRGRR